jgi:phosphate/sulfate permease
MTNSYINEYKQIIPIFLFVQICVTCCFVLAISWVVSPLLAAIIAAIFYLVIKYAVMQRKDPFEAALQLMPIFFWFALAVNFFTVFYHGSQCEIFRLHFKIENEAKNAD